MATVHDLPDFRIGEQPTWALVYKRYKKSIRPVPIFGLEALVKMREVLHADQVKALDRSFNWMVRVVTDSGSGAAGVILPRLDASYFIDLHTSYGDVKSVPAEGQFLAADREYCAQKRIVFPSIDQRMQLCISLVKGMGLLHRAEVVYGDLSLRNFLFRLSPQPSVIFVDTDAMRSRGSTSSLGLQPHTPDWEPPEALQAKARKDSIGFATQNQDTDRYKLGLAVLRILADGPRVAEKRDPTLVKRVLPRHLYALLEQSLLGPPAARPPAKTWYEEFRR
ncbi:MAG: hypothetical protein ACT4P1_11410 [Sporichthyaceae bacterium]